MTGGETPLGKENVKIGPLLSLYYGFSNILVFSRLLFFRVFSGDLGFCIAPSISEFTIIISPFFSECWLVGPFSEVPLLDQTSS